jgi:hypothetical protein
MLCCAISLIFAAVSGGAAEEFSATVVTTSPAQGTMPQAGRVLVANGKVHLELPDFPDGHFLVDPAANTAYFVRPAHRVFMEARQSSRLAQILVVVDPEDPCRQWQAVAQITGAAKPDHPWQCTRSDAEGTEMRDTIRYVAIAPDLQRYDVWIDPKAKFSIRIGTEIGASVEITNIEEGPQPQAAFEIPAGFSKFDPQGLIDRIKQSDVWVEPPHSE